MGLKGFFKLLFKDGSEIKALRAEVASLKGELSVIKGSKLTSEEAVVLEEGLNGGSKIAAVGDGYQAVARRGAAASTMRSGESFYIKGIQSGETLEASNVYRSTIDDVIQIGDTKISLSDPRIVKALERKGIDGEIVIGRNNNCDVVINDGLVSGEHLIIRQKCPGSKRLYIEDLGSTNGTQMIKANNYTQADRLADAARSDEYIAGLGKKSTSAGAAAKSSSALSRGKGDIEVPYNGNCRIIINETQPGTKLLSASDYLAGTSSKLRIGEEEISLSDPIIKQALKSKSTITIGRDPRCDVVINNETVSRTHLQITKLGNGKLMLRELGSTNGTQFVQ